MNASQGNFSAALWDLVGVVGRVAGFNASCFAAGTPILTPDGAMLVEEVKLGDWVSITPRERPVSAGRGPVSWKRFSRVSPRTRRSYSGGADDSHNCGASVARGRPRVDAWCRPLQRGLFLTAALGTPVRVQGIATRGESAAVYNMRVEGFHTYFVGCGDMGLWRLGTQYLQEFAKSPFLDSQSLATARSKDNAIPRQIIFTGNRKRYQHSSWKPERSDEPS